MSDRDETMGMGMHEDDSLRALDRALDPAEIAEIMRLDRALARVERDEPSDVDPAEDPELAGLLTAALSVDHSFEATTDTRSFHSFHARSRAAILHQLQEERPIPFRERLRVVVAAAAGLAAVTISVASFGGPIMDNLRGDAGGGANVTVASLTHVSTQEQLDRLSLAVDGIRQRALSGQTLSSAEIQAFSENAARVADSIERQPDTLSPEAVRAYIERTQAAQAALSTSPVEPGAEGAAVVAQRVAEDGITVASRYLGGEGGADGSPLPGATETPETTPTPEPTSEPTATPTGTAAPTSEATPAPDGTATPTPTPTSTETPTATSSAAEPGSRED